jgi:hypothetical protein
MWGRGWEPIDGRVIASKIHRVITGDSGTQTQWEYVVEYSVDGGESQRATLKQAASWVWGMKMINPAEGHSVPLLLNRGSGKVRFDVENPRINREAISKREKANRDAAFKQAQKP